MQLALPHIPLRSVVQVLLLVKDSNAVATLLIRGVVDDYFLYDLELLGVVVRQVLLLLAFSLQRTRIYDSRGGLVVVHQLLWSVDEGLPERVVR